MASNSVLQKMQEVVPYYIAKYVDWYLSDKDERCAWEIYASVILTIV